MPHGTLSPKPDPFERAPLEALPATATRVALVHDWLNQWGGAEAVLSEMVDLLPHAPVYTTLVDLNAVPEARSWQVHVSALDRLPFARRRHQWLLPLYPLVWSRTVVKGADLVVSNKSAFAFGVDPGQAAHACYCLTPTRFVWDPEEYVRHEALPPGARLALRPLLPWLRRFELAAARRVTAFAAISKVVQERIWRIYGRDSTIVYPPVDTGAYAVTPADLREPYYLVLARLVPYKRLDLAVEAFTRLGRRLVVVGSGRDEARLKALAGPGIDFRGHLSSQEVKSLLAGCEALIWPGVEDFGLAPVEAMAAGRPVVARRAGGVLDTVVEGETGVFFDAPDPDALAAAVLAAEDSAWNPGIIRQHAARFDRRVFRRELVRFLETTLAIQTSSP